MSPFLSPAIAGEAKWEDSELLEPTPVLFVPEGAPWRGFARGHCTAYVASRRKITFRGDAKHWPENAVRAGYSLSSSPFVGAVVVTTESRYGHVAYVESLTETTITVSEMNYVGRGIVSTRTLRRDDKRIRTFIL